MPGVYGRDEYDLAGFVVGAVERSSLLPKKSAIVVGDALIGIASSGIHSNGFNLVRHIVDKFQLTYASVAPFAPEQTLGIIIILPKFIL